MTAFEDTALIYAALGGLLVIVTILLAQQSADLPNPIVENLNQHVKAWWLMAVLIGVAFLFGRIGVIVLFAIASFTALREFVTLTEMRRGDHYALIVAFFVVLPLQYVLVASNQYALYSIFIPAYVFLFLPVIAALRDETTRFMEWIGVTQWALMLSVFCLSHVPALLTLHIPGYAGRSLLLIAFLILVVQASDVLQYAWGRLYAKRRSAPKSSPSRTWQGFFGGVGTATLLGAALWWITPFNPWQALLLALSISLAGFLGGFVMSAIRRDRGVKDWGQTIEGHGGVLDRLDSVIFAAPVFFHLTRYFFAS